jgi:hypothetical protein
LDRRPSGPQSQSVRGGEEKNSQPTPEIEPPNSDSSELPGGVEDTHETVSQDILHLTCEMNIDRDVRYATTHTKGEKQYGKSSQN